MPPCTETMLLIYHFTFGGDFSFTRDPIPFISKSKFVDKARLLHISMYRYYIY